MANSTKPIDNGTHFSGESIKSTKKSTELILLNFEKEKDRTKANSISQYLQIHSMTLEDPTSQKPSRPSQKGHVFLAVIRKED